MLQSSLAAYMADISGLQESSTARDSENSARFREHPRPHLPGLCRLARCVVEIWQLWTFADQLGLRPESTRHYMYLIRVDALARLARSIHFGPLSIEQALLSSGTRPRRMVRSPAPNRVVHSMSGGTRIC